MCLKKLTRLHHTLAFRLTLWYTGIFTSSFLAAFVLFYLLITSVNREHIDQELLSDKTEFTSLFAFGMDTVKTEIGIETDSEGANKIFFRFMTLKGDELATSNMSYWGDIGISKNALIRLHDGAKYFFETIKIPGHNHKARILYSIIGQDTIMQVGRSFKDYERLMDAFRQIFGTTMAIIAVFAALIGWFMAKRALVGVEEVTQTALSISDGSLDKRVPMRDRGDEVERLATTFNNMLDRIESLIGEMREMTDNIAHDLKSPVTRIRGLAEMTLTTGKSLDEFKDMAADTIEECDYLLVMINTMLDISEVKAGADTLIMDKIDISDIIKVACELFQPLADEKGLTINTELPATCFCNGDKRKLQRMVANILDNAIKYTQCGGTVSITVKKDKQNVVISVEDTGAGISRDDLHRIFKRFYRCNQSRTKEGAGLGLSLAHAIAKAHHGNITVTSSPGKGSIFTVNLPR